MVIDGAVLFVVIDRSADVEHKKGVSSFFSADIYYHVQLLSSISSSIYYFVLLINITYYDELSLFWGRFMQRIYSVF